MNLINLHLVVVCHVRGDASFSSLNTCHAACANNNSLQLDFVTLSHNLDRASTFV